MKRSVSPPLVILAAVVMCAGVSRAASAQNPCTPDLAGGAAPAGGARVETDRHFIVLAGRSGTFYDQSGPAFAMLLKASGLQTQIDAVGIHAAGKTPVFGAVPAPTYGEFLKEPRRGSDVMLRLEISGAQYERTLRVLKTWERRAREGALLYPDVFMNNVLFVKQVTEELNRCGHTVDLYTLDWGLEDNISENNGPPNIPFLYFKELRRLNEARHVRDGKMPKLALQPGVPVARTVP